MPDAANNINDIFPLGQPLPQNWFTGNAFLHPLVARNHNHTFSAGAVSFEAGARTNWHTHPRGQVLIVLAGNGFYQEKGSPARAIRKGDVVNIPENIEHWHGASAANAMTHIAITNFENEVQVTWLAPVTEAEYATVQTKE